MSRDAISTVTSSIDSATDQDFRSVTGTDVTISGTAKRAADIRVAHNIGADAVPIQDGGNSITVDATDLDIRDLSHTQDSVRIGDGIELVNVNASNELQTRDDDANTSLTSIDGKLVDGNDIGDVTINNASGASAVNVQDGGNSLTVDAIDLDIRDLSNTQDSVAVGDATNIIDVQTLDSAFSDTGNGVIIVGVRQDALGSPVSADGDAHPLVFNNDGEARTSAEVRSKVADDAADSDNPIKVGGRGVSGALTALSATNDRYDLLGDLYRRTWVNTSHNIAILNSAETVTASAAEVVSTPLAGRREITIQNRGTASVFVGSSSGVTSANGIEIPRKSSGTFRWGPDINIFMISATGSQDVRFMESA